MHRVIMKSGKLFILLLFTGGLMFSIHMMIPDTPRSTSHSTAYETYQWETVGGEKRVQTVKPVEPVKSMKPLGQKKLIKSLGAEESAKSSGAEVSVKSLAAEESVKSLEAEKSLKSLEAEKSLKSLEAEKSVKPGDPVEQGKYHQKGIPSKSTEAPTAVSSTNWGELTSNDPVLTNWTSCASSMFSAIHLHEKKDSYNIGDVVIMNITLKDFSGSSKTIGGDAVRIIVKDAISGTRSIGFVLDKHDGSYMGVVKLFWAGDITIEGIVSTPRELIRLMYHNVRTGKQRRPIVGNFTRGKNITTVDCTPVEEIANHYKEKCNLTHKNAGLPWFCEKPQNFSCQQWKNAYQKRAIDLTGQEIQMIEKVGLRQKMKTTINLKVTRDSATRVHFIQENKRVPCNKLPAKETWFANTPTGYLYNGTWYPTLCEITFSGSVKSYERCLLGRRVWLLGDSNMRAMTEHFMKVMNLSLVTEKWTKLRWHKASLASNTEGTISVFWGMHALPRYASESAIIKASHEYIDSIPAGSKDIVVVHFYVHFQPFHPAAIRNHIRRTAQSVKALKARAPDAKVVVRGSHSMFMQTEISHFDDFWGMVYNQILKEEFESLFDNVTFLDVWDITAATENLSMHPSLAVLGQVVNYMMALLCP